MLFRSAAACAAAERVSAGIASRRASDVLRKSALNSSIETVAIKPVQNARPWPAHNAERTQIPANQISKPKCGAAMAVGVLIPGNLQK